MSNATIAPIRIEGRHPSKKEKLTDNIVIGKDILELLSGAMYVEPLTIFREYVQNSTDAIDEAEKDGLYSNNEQPRVEIVVELGERKLRIRDHGIGVDNASFARRLTALGASKKRGTPARGFRGVGRLSGLGYCQELIFRSRSAKDPKVMELSWDGRRFKEILLNPQYKGDLNDVVREVTTLTTHSGADYPKHFFEVELRGVARYKNDVLLNEQEIEQYLAQVAPVPFHPDFSFGEQLEKRLNQFGLGRTYDVFVRSTVATDSELKQVFRPFRDHFPVFGGSKDRFTRVDFIELTGTDGNLAAVGWALDHGYYGAIPRSSGIKGLRLRSGNIQVGSDEILAEEFPEPRFNSWMVGEIHVISPKLIPNGRRDAFESNAQYLNLQSHVAAYAKIIAKTCRDRSKTRNQERRFNFEAEKIEEKLRLVRRSSLPSTIRNKLRKEITAHVKVLEKLVTSVAESRVRRKFEYLLSRVKARVGKNMDEVALKDPLARLPKAKQDLYRQVFELIFECSPNRIVAGALVDKLLIKLIR